VPLSSKYGKQGVSGLSTAKRQALGGGIVREERSLKLITKGRKGWRMATFRETQSHPHRTRWLLISGVAVAIIVAVVLVVVYSGGGGSGGGY